MNKKAYIQINNLQMNSTPFRYSQSPWAVQVVGIESPWVVRRNNDSVISKGTVKSTDIICTFWMSLRTIQIQTLILTCIHNRGSQNCRSGPGRGCRCNWRKFRWCREPIVIVSAAAADCKGVTDICNTNCHQRAIKNEWILSPSNLPQMSSSTIFNCSFSSSWFCSVIYLPVRWGSHGITYGP